VTSVDLDFVCDTSLNYGEYLYQIIFIPQRMSKLQGQQTNLNILFDL
jgi:hypothetical protein